MATLPHKRRAFAALLCLLALTTAVSPAVGAAKEAKEHKISLLYVLNAKGATLIPQKGSKTRYRLTVKRPQRDVVWFSDRPERKSGAFPVGSLARNWAGFGFGSDPPNVAIDYVDARGRNRTAMVELTDPQLGKSKIAFTARLLKPAAVIGRNLVSHADAADITPPRRMRDVALFVDDLKATVLYGCVFQPYTVCTNVQFGRVELYEIDLTGADFSGSAMFGYIERVNFTNADLSGGSLAADYNESNFEGANLSGTMMWESGFFATSLKGANLTNAWINETLFQNSNLRGAQLAGATVFKTRFCNTTMPDGSVSSPAACS